MKVRLEITERVHSENWRYQVLPNRESKRLQQSTETTGKTKLTRYRYTSKIA